jgi:hypothetical protein
MYKIAIVALFPNVRIKVSVSATTSGARHRLAWQLVESISVRLAIATAFYPFVVERSTCTHQSIHSQPAIEDCWAISASRRQRRSKDCVKKVHDLGLFTINNEIGWTNGIIIIHHSFLVVEDKSRLACDLQDLQNASQRKVLCIHTEWYPDGGFERF